MAMGAETLARLHAILVDHSQRPPMHVLGVVVVGEREAVPGVEPAVIGVATFMCGTQGDHGLAPQAVRRRLAIRLSRLYWPAPCAASTRNPPAMAMFFIRLICSAAAPWNRKPLATANTANASATQRVNRQIGRAHV